MLGYYFFFISAYIKSAFVKGEYFSFSFQATNSVRANYQKICERKSVLIYLKKIINKNWTCQRKLRA